MARMSAKQHANEMLRLKQRAAANRLRMCGLKQDAIAAKLGICQQTISRWLAEERETELAKINIAKHLWKSEQAAKLETVQNEAFIGWYRSLRDAVEVRRSSDDRSGESETTTTKGQCGSPSHLAQVIHASERLAALLGLDAPQAKDPAENASEPVPVAEVIITDQEQAERLRDVHVVSIRADEIRML
jgi:DNA-binding transcriptional regulator LsrR (DeoR family)